MVEVHVYPQIPMWLTLLDCWIEVKFYLQTTNYSVWKVWIWCCSHLYSMLESKYDHSISVPVKQKIGKVCLTMPCYLFNRFKSTIVAESHSCSFCCSLFLYIYSEVCMPSVPLQMLFLIMYVCIWCLSITGQYMAFAFLLVYYIIHS